MLTCAEGSLSTPWHTSPCHGDSSCQRHSSSALWLQASEAATSSNYGMRWFWHFLIFPTVCHHASLPFVNTYHTSNIMSLKLHMELGHVHPYTIRCTLDIQLDWVKTLPKETVFRMDASLETASGFIHVWWFLQMPLGGARKNWLSDWCTTAKIYRQF